VSFSDLRGPAVVISCGSSVDKHPQQIQRTCLSYIEPMAIVIVILNLMQSHRLTARIAKGKSHRRFSVSADIFNSKVKQRVPTNQDQL
jgi:hypothetical protein